MEGSNCRLCLGNFVRVTPHSSSLIFIFRTLNVTSDYIVEAFQDFILVQINLIWGSALLGERGESGLKTVPVDVQWDLPRGESPVTCGIGSGIEGRGSTVLISGQQRKVMSER